MFFLSKIYKLILCLILSSCGLSKNDIVSGQYVYEVSDYSPLTVNSHASEGGLAFAGKKKIMVVYRKDPSLSHISNSSRIVAKTSLNNGKTWGNEVTVYDSRFDDRNLVVGNLPNGNIIIVFRRYNFDSQETVDSGFIISKDDGNSWSDYEKIVGSEKLLNQPFGRIVTTDNETSFLINYGDTGIVKKYFTNDNFSSSPKERTIIKYSSKILQEPFLVNLSGTKSIILFRNGNGGVGQSSYFQYNSINGNNYYYKGETNIFNDFDRSVRSPVSLRYDFKTNLLEVCTNSRILAHSSRNPDNELRIYRQDADIIFENQKKYELKHVIKRPLPSNHWFYGYPKHINISKKEVLYIITDSKINDLTISPLRHISNEQANLYSFKIYRTQK